MAIGALLLCAKRGYLRIDALSHSPQRDIGLTLIDVVIALGLMIVGGSATNLLLLSWIGANEAGGLALHTPMHIASANLLGQLLAQGAPAGYLLWKATRTSGGLRRLGVWPPRSWAAGVLGLLVALSMVMSVMIATAMIGLALGDPTPKVGHALLQTLQDSNSVWVTGLLVFSAVGLAPVLEELIYRGLLQTSLSAASGWRLRWAAIGFTSLGFAAMHSSVPWQALPALFVLSVILGWLYERTGSLWPNVLVHMGFNAFNMAMALAMAPG